MTVPSLEGLAPFQIAFVVRDIERAARELDRRLSAGPWRGWLFGPQGEGREYRGSPAEWTLRLALNDRSPQFELIEPVDGPSIHADWLEERGEGFHHVAYVVESLERTTAEMAAAGHPAIARIHSFGAPATARPPTSTPLLRSASWSRPSSRRLGCRRSTSRSIEPAGAGSIACTIR